MQHNRPRFPALRRLGFRSFGSVLLLSLLMVLATVAPTHAAPPLPSSFYGTVQVSGVDAPAGMRVSASIDGVTIVETMTRVEDGRSVYALDVLGDDPDTPGVEGGVDGKTIVFHVDGLAAAQTALWQSGENVRLDLAADHLPTPPVADDQALNTNEDTPLPVLLAGSDLNNDALSFRVVDGPQHGTLSDTDPRLVYTPDADFHGADSFTFVANDGAADSNLATVSITVEPVNDAPNLAPLTDVVMDEGETQTVQVVASDMDGDPLALSASGLPPFAAFIDHGDGTGRLTLSPGFEDAGDYAGISIEASDGAFADAEFFAVTVTEGEALPVAAFTTGGNAQLARWEDGARVVDFSSTGTGSRIPENAIDSISNTYWQTSNGNNRDQWITVELIGDHPHTIGAVVIEGSDAGYDPRNFEIRVSTEGTDEADFTTAFTGVFEEGIKLQSFTFTPVPARYVQLRVLDNYNALTILVRTFQVKTRPRQGGIVSLVEGGLPVSVVDVSSASTSNAAPEFAFDHSLHSLWRTDSRQVTDQWIEVELGGGRIYTVDRLRLKTVAHGRGVRDFEVQVATTEDAAFTTVFSGTAANTNALQEFVFEPVPARYVRFVAKNNYGDGFHIDVAAIQVLTPDRLHATQIEGVNASVAAWSSQSHDHPAVHAVDFKIDGGLFDPGTFWETQPGNVADQWIKILLSEGKTYPVDRVRMRTGKGDRAPKEIEILVSTESLNANDFRPVASALLPNDGLEHWIVFPPTPAKYVQLLVKSNHGNAGTVRVDEFAAYATNVGEENVPFDDLSISPLAEIVDWRWDFGDGSISTEQHPIHTYATPGTYTVTLTVTDSNLLTGTHSMPYTVVPRPQVDLIWAPLDVAEGATVVFTDTSTAAANSHLLQREWHFDHTSTVYGNHTVNTKFPDNGEYKVALTQFDTNFLHTTTVHTVSVANLPPVVNAGLDVTLPVSFTWSADAYVTDPSTVDYPSVICEWDYGDGNTIVIDRYCYSTADRSHVYALPGIYTATLTATDKDGASASDQVVVTVRKRKTILSIYALRSLSETEAEVKLALWDDDQRAPVAGAPVDLHWQEQSFVLTTDAQGVATVVLPVVAEETVSLEAIYAGSIYYEPAETRINAVAGNDPEEFWLAFASVNHNSGGPASVDLFISSEYETAGMVEVPGLGFRYPFAVVPGAVAHVQLPLNVRMTPSTITENKGIYVTAINDVNVYGMAYLQYASDAYLGLPVDYLGTDYIVAARDGLFDNSLLAIAATEDNTTVVFTPTIGSGPVTLNLNEGQVHQFMPKVTGDLTGSRVTSNKPVAVLGGHTCAYVPDSVEGKWCNHLIEQMYPVDTWGKQFVALSMAGRASYSPGDRFRVLAAHDDTEVAINGAAPVFLNQGQYHEVVVKDTIFVTATQPILLIQYAQGRLTSGPPGDPSMMLIPPYEQFMDNYPAVVAPALTFVANYVNVVAPAAAIGAVTLDGEPIPAEQFVPIGESGFLGARIPISSGTHSLQGALPFGIFMYGYGEDDNYSYAGGLTLGEIAAAKVLTTTPQTATQLIGQQHCVATTVADESGRTLSDIRVDFATTGAHTITGQDVTGAGLGARFCYTGSATGTDTITATVGALTSTATVTWIDALSDLIVAKEASATTMRAGDLITYTLTITNSGRADATAVVLTDTLPAELLFLAGSNGGSEVDGIVTWPSFDLAADDTMSYTVTVRVVDLLPDGATVITNTATAFGVESAGLDADPTNNTASIGTLILTNGAPVAANDSFTLTEDSETAVMSVLANDEDPDGDVLTLAAVGIAANGATAVGDGAVLYTLAVDFHGTDVFSYTVSDGEFSDTATVTVTVNPVNDAPVAVDDEATTPEDTSLVLHALANDRDVDGDSLLIETTTQPVSGTLAISDTLLVYTPTHNVHGVDAFRYVASDGVFTDTATVTVTVSPVNDAPSAGDDTAITDETVPVTVDVLANDTDVDGDPLAVEAVTQPANGESAIALANTLAYTPAAGFSGVDRFDYAVSDGTFSVTATVTITVNRVNKAPLAVADAFTVTEDSTGNDLDVLSNDSDPDGDPLAVATVGTPQFGAATVGEQSSTLRYTPDPDVKGTDVFTYTVSDGAIEDTTSVTITIVPVNDAPLANSQTITTVEDTAVAITLSGSDVDGDDLRYSVVTTPTHGALSGTAPDLIYAPAADYKGEDSFTFVVDDGDLDSDVAIVTLVVEPVNDAPIAVDDVMETDEDVPVTLDVLANDEDVDGDPLTVLTVTQPLSGAAIISGSLVLYMPELDVNGTDVFTYTVSDGQASDTATVTVTVVAANDAPLAIDDLVMTDLNTAITVDVLANDSDVEGDPLTLVGVGEPVTGTAAINGSQVVYTPDLDFYGTDSFTYTVSDDSGAQSTAVVVVSVELPPVVPCALYPIALHAEMLAEAGVDDVLADIYGGTQPGNFGWLTWSGNPNVPTLVNNLTPPGNSETYVNPHDPGDHLISVGDWVQGKPGVSNAKPVRDALDNLLGESIIVPVWDETEGQGNNANYRVAGYARVKLVDYTLPGENRISAQFLGLTFCGETDLVTSASEDDALDQPRPETELVERRVHLPLMFSGGGVKHIQAAVLHDRLYLPVLSR